MRERKVVFGARLVEVPEVNAHPNFPVFLGYLNYVGQSLWIV